MNNQTAAQVIRSYRATQPVRSEIAEQYSEDLLAELHSIGTVDALEIASEIELDPKRRAVAA